MARATEHLGKDPGLELMLRVIRDDADSARAAYATWRTCYPLDDIQINAMKLVPRVALRLEEIGVEDGDTRRLRGISRYLWVRSEMMMDGAREISHRLLQQGIRTLAMKGVALRAMRAVEPMMRPMVDVDLVLEHRKQCEAASKFLVREKWEVVSASPHATTFVKGQVAIDLHNYALPADPRMNVWRNADLTNITQNADGPRYAVLAPTEAMIVTVVHGRWQNSGVTWVLDAEDIINKLSVDWQKILDYARERAFVLTFATLLKRVRGVPREVLDRFDKEPCSHMEALELRFAMTKGDQCGGGANRVMLSLREHDGRIDASKYENQRLAYFDARWVREWR